jgi:hypothetical protein
MKNTCVQKIIRDAVVCKLALTGSILGFGIIGLNPAQAALLNNGTGISNPATIIDFSDLPLINSVGITFSGLQLDRNNGGFPNITLPAARNFPTADRNSFNIADNPFLIRFAQPQSRAAFSLVTEPSTSTIEALLNGSLVERFSIGTDRVSTNNFYGFTGITFDAIRVTAGGFNGIAIIDNIQFGTATAQSVPEPFSIIGTLVGGTAAFRLRKKLADAHKV